MKDRMNKPVDVICYGVREHFETRKEARDKYLEAMAAGEGAEQERYTTIYIALANGTADVVTDGSSERVESMSSVKFTIEDKEKIIKLIEAGELSINSHEIYDRGTCKLLIEDRDVIKALLRKEGWYAAQFLRKYIENDKELLLVASCTRKDDRGALAYASDELCDNKKFVFEMLEYDASDFRYVSDRLANDIEVVAKAFQCAKTEYDFNCIKEGFGKELLTEIVNEVFQARLERQQEVPSLEAKIAEAEKENKRDVNEKGAIYKDKNDIDR